MRQAQKGKTQAERERAARLLVYYNQSFVKYMVKGFHYPQGEISSDELTAEGVISLPQAIKDFDLAKSENRLASYAGYWVHQRIRSFIKRSQLLPQITPKKKPQIPEGGEEGTERKIPTKTPSTGIVYYDRDYQTGEKDDKTTSLLDTLADGDEKMEQQIQQRETKRKINDLLACLEIHEELIVRLFFGIVPTNSSQIDRLATKEKAKELKKPKSKNKEKTSLFEKYSKFFATPLKREEVAQTLLNSEFWEYFREFPESAAKPQTSRRGKPKTKLVKQTIDFDEQKKWNKAGLISEETILRWINLGYQPEDFADPQSQILQELGITKKEKEQWQKASSKTKIKNWLEQRLAKAMENRKKDILEKLKILREEKS